MVGLVGRFVNFPYEIRKDGICSKLTEDNKCSIYFKRPDVCRIKVMASKQNTFTEKEYYKQVTNVCNALILANKQDLKYLLDPEIYEEKE
jgi:Fe-S-cluster containining protein